MNNVHVYGLSAKAKHGKDTLYEIIKKLHPQVVRVAFADALKEEVAEACGVTVDFINQHKDLFRPMLQWWGTEFRRQLNGNDYWIRRLEDKLSVLPEGTVVFVTDTRFQNEAEFVRSGGGHILRLVRPGYVSDRGASHASEVELESISPDSLIVASTVEELQQEATLWWQSQLQQISSNYGTN
jgi:hypothetical protein